MSLLDTFKHLDYTDLEFDAIKSLELIVALGRLAGAAEKVVKLSPVEQKFVDKFVSLADDAQEFLDEFSGDSPPSGSAPTPAPSVPPT
jgi:hypothetical protein